MFLLFCILLIITKSVNDSDFSSIKNDQFEIYASKNQNIKILDESTIKEKQCYPAKPKENCHDLINKNYTFDQYETIYGCSLDSTMHINAKECQVLILKCSFQSLITSNNGGAIYIRLSNDSKFQEKSNLIEKCSFKKCKANKGGALYISTLQSSFNFDIIDNIFQNNEAMQSGGGIYFGTVHGNIYYCHFIDNICEQKEGSDITFEFTIPDVMLTDSLNVQCNKFDHSKLNGEINSFFYFNHKEPVYFTFTDNTINISLKANSNFYIFDSFQSNKQFEGEFKFDRICILPFDITEKRIKGPNFDYDIGNPFITDSLTNIPNDFYKLIIYDDAKKSMNERCKYSSNEEQKISVIVTVSKFSGYKQRDENGGAICIENCALECANSIFEDCISFTGGGGAIFFTKSITVHENNLNLTNINFKRCKAVYGGALYIYSLSRSSNISVSFCSFHSNEILNRESLSVYQLFGGSSVFLTARIGTFLNCSFNGNKGESGSFKIFGNFESKFENSIYIHLFEEYSEQKSILIVNCSFDEKESENSIFFVNKIQGSPVELINCNFSGKLKDNQYYIGGILHDKNATKILIKSCNFEENLKISSNNDLIEKFWAIGLTQILNNLIKKLILYVIIIESLILIAFKLMKF